MQPKILGLVRAEPYICDVGAPTGFRILDAQFTEGKFIKPINSNLTLKVKKTG